MRSELFSLVLNNVLLSRLIFTYVKRIHNVHLQCIPQNIYNWQRLITNTNHILIKNNYIELFKEYLVKNHNSINKLDHYYFIKVAILNCRINFLQYIQDDLHINYNQYLNDKEILEYGVQSKQLEMINYLEINQQNNNNETNNKFIIKGEFFKILIYHLSESINTVEWIEWIFTRIESRQLLNAIQHTILKCATKGYLTAMQWLFKELSECTKLLTPIFFYDLTTIALCNGHVDIAEWLHVNHYIPQDFTSNIDKIAELKNNLDCIKWASTHYRSYATVKAMNSSMHGDIDVIEWLHYNRTEGCTSDAMDRAINFKRLDIVEWLNENRVEKCSDLGLSTAVYCKNREMVIYILESQLSTPTNMLQIAKRCGDKYIMKFYHEILSYLNLLETTLVDDASQFETILYDDGNVY